MLVGHSHSVRSQVLILGYKEIGFKWSVKSYDAGEGMTCPSLPTQELEGLPGTFQVTGRDNRWQLLITQETAGDGRNCVGAYFDLLSILSQC